MLNEYLWHFLTLTSASHTKASSNSISLITFQSEAPNSTQVMRNDTAINPAVNCWCNDSQAVTLECGRAWTLKIVGAQHGNTRKTKAPVNICYFWWQQRNRSPNVWLSVSLCREGWVFTVRCRSVTSSSSKREEEGCPGTKQPSVLHQVADLHPSRSRRTVLSRQKQSIWAPGVFCSPTSKVRSEMSSMSTSPEPSVSPAPSAATPSRSEWASPQPQTDHGKVS